MARWEFERRKRGHCRGQSIIEVSLLAPWIFLLFIALFDFGVYAYSALATANAARAAALATARDEGTANSQLRACDVAKEEMKRMWNAGPFLDPADSARTNPAFTCNVSPLQVQAVRIDALDNSDACATRVSVTYTSPPLFPLPFMMGQFTLTRIAEMRVYGPSAGASICAGAGT